MCIYMWIWMGFGRFWDQFWWILEGLCGFGEVWGPNLVGFGGFLVEQTFIYYVGYGRSYIFV